jgi:hypothetical protein
VSVSTHVPKPHTPFQWCAMDTHRDVREQKQGWLEEEARAANVELRTHDCDTSWLEAVFARGDRRSLRFLERAYRAGARFDSWEDQKKIGIWEAAFRRKAVDPAKYLGTIPVARACRGITSTSASRRGSCCANTARRSTSRLSRLPCGKVAGAFVHATNLRDASGDTRKLVCYDCGIACDLSAMREQRLVFAQSSAPTSRARAPAASRPRAATAAPRHRRKTRAATASSTRSSAPSAFLSHLDLIRALPRAFRRLELPLHYSQGFHPKPDMTFGPALSLGVASLGEVST